MTLPHCCGFVVVPRRAGGFGARTPKSVRIFQLVNGFALSVLPRFFLGPHTSAQGNSAHKGVLQLRAAPARRSWQQPHSRSCPLLSREQHHPWAMANAKKDRVVSYFYHEEIGNFCYGGGNPMRPHRARLVFSLLKTYGLTQNMSIHRPAPRSFEQLTEFHADGARGRRPSGAHDTDGRNNPPARSAQRPAPAPAPAAVAARRHALGAGSPGALPRARFGQESKHGISLSLGWGRQERCPGRPCAAAREPAAPVCSCVAAQTTSTSCGP